ncbi:PREDICTED: uncharacterized protein LOC104798610 [Tarenaya hassleriana]|uniref:uncharacterized protein LOC104798610 n=1 Tax=Tarenaya hassleriana TaxID=28532 RepID=UPI00053C6375|nr:PREDICTED: uncharacterized protein LOC104798610 [Tarenaya hassleriana]
MGCAASSIDKEEKVLVCKERKRLMKRLLGFRGEFADAQLAYLRALRNTGVTLRQFTESELLELENPSYGLSLPFSPPPTLPPSPPPPPPFSPPIPSSSWNYWDPFESSGPSNGDNVVEYTEPKCRELAEEAEEEYRAETKTGSEEEACLDLSVQRTEATGGRKVKLEEVTAGNSSMVRWYGKDSEKMTASERRIRRTLEGIIRELDDYFLKASGCEKEIAVIIDIATMDATGPPRYKEIKRKRSNSPKVFSSLSWSWSSKSLQLSRDAMESCPVEPCRPGAHCRTLEKLYAAEKKLYEHVRNKEIAKMEHERKSALLQKKDEENHDHGKTEKTRLSVESLEADINRLEDSIRTTCLCLQKLINEELYPQLVALTSGLEHMWKTMQKCHHVQIRISQQLIQLSDYPNMDLSSEYKRQAATQLETEVSRWYNSFCKLVNSQREYVKTLCKWTQRTNSLSGEGSHGSSLSEAARKLCKEWQLVFDNLPDKVASDAIKSLLLSIQSIIHQQAEEYSLKKKCGKVEKRLEKELNSLAEIERKLEGTEETSDSTSGLSSKHPLSIKRAKIEELRKRMETEKGNYLNSVEASKRMTMENLKSSLPLVFQALSDFANAFSRGFEAVHRHIEPDVYDDDVIQT